MIKRIGGFAVLTASTVAGFKIGSFLPQSQYEITQYPESLKDHPYTQKLLQQGWQLDPHQLAHVPSFHRKSMALSGILAGKNKFMAAPISLVRGDDHQTVFWLGDELTHATGTNNWKWVSKEVPTVHNGIAITLLDHNLAQTALKGGQRALTKSLSAEFVKDIPVGVIALESTQLERRSRSASANGTIYQVIGDKRGDKLASGNVVMVRPKWAPKWLP